MDRQTKEAQGDQRVVKAILDSIPLGLFVVDRQWQILYLNRQAERFFEQLTGRTRDHLLGKNIWEVCPEVADSTFSREFHLALEDQRTFELETFYPALNRWFGVLASPAEDIRCFYLRDITDRVRVERELRLVLEQLTEADRAAPLSPDVLRGLLTAFERTSQSHRATIA